VSERSLQECCIIGIRFERIKEVLMFTQYLNAAMQRARFEILSDGAHYGEIPCLQGVWACGETLGACRNELQEVLECWLVLGLKIDTIGKNYRFRGIRFTLLRNET
jgi:predicted RNase H-like HicB family nuclease